MLNTIKSRAHHLLAALALVLVSSPTLSQFRLLDSIVAVVDNDVVMASELDERVTTIYQRILETGTEAPPREVLIPQVLDRLILERIQLDMARRAGIRVSDEEINATIASIARGEGLTPEQFLQVITSQGLSVAALREQLSTEIILARVQQAQVNRRIYISEQEVTNFLASDEGRNFISPDVNLGHILLPLSSAASLDEVQAAYDKARTILDRINAGDDFRNLAIVHSADQSALQGGDLGWRKMAELPDVFIAPLSELQPGQVTDVIRSNAGLHILKLYDKRGGEQQLIQQSKARHILLKPNEIRDDEATYNELAKIAESIRNGSATFAEMARQHSEDLGSALSGGDLGWSLPGKFVPEFEQVMDSIPINEVSAPFRSQFGWHILQVTERRDQDFSEDIKRHQAETILRQRKFESELQIWLQEIRDEAYIDIKI
ncbi:MAG TPA: peptidylprolyl isomerase [Porticoccaceae bacterium]